MSLLIYWKYSNYLIDIKEKDKHNFNSNQQRIHDVHAGDDAFLVTGIPTTSGFNLFILGHFIIASKSYNPPDYKYGRYRINGDPSRSKFFNINPQNPVTPVIRKLASINHFSDVKKYCNAFQTIRELGEADTETLKEYIATLDTFDPGNYRDMEKPEALVKQRNRSNSYTIQSLKIFYEYKCQICGPNTVGGNIVEGHHIRALSEAGNDDPKNILILCPNHHRLMHSAKGKLDLTQKEIYYENTGQVDKLVLYDHLIQ